jgi:protein phosphatase
MTGKQNEDRYAVSAYRVDAQDARPSLFAVVSDGIGGHRAGEVAAEITVNTVSHVVAQSDARKPLETLAEAISTASLSISTQAQQDPSQQGMGSTCACVWVVDNRMYTASIGDSRIYLLRGETLYQLTTDHTWIQEALEKGVLTPKDVEGHPNVHVIRRYLGSARPPIADVRMRMHPEETDTQALANQGMRIIPNDVILLCTDGITDLVSDVEIRDLLRIPDPRLAAQYLIDLANERGGHDNSTAILLSVPPKAVPASKQKFARWNKVVLAAALFFVVTVILTVLALFWWDPGIFLPETPPPGAAATDGISSPLPDDTAMPPVSQTPTPPGIDRQQATYTPWPTRKP